MSRKMKDSGIEWIGEIPEEWSTKRVQAMFQYLKEKTIPGRSDVLSLTLKGIIQKDLDNLKGLSPSSYDTYQVIQKKDLVFKLIDLANYQTSRVGLSNFEGIVSPVYIRLKPLANVNPVFAYYQFYDWYLRGVFNALGGNGVRSSVTASDLIKLRLATPSLSEQQAIADYLDAKVEEIDTNISKLKTASALLSELKQSVIYEAVTGKTFEGKVIDRKMKDSGVEWIGEIPEGWQLARVGKYLTRYKRSYSQGLPILSLTTKHKNGMIVRDATFKGKNVSDTSTYQTVNKGDLVLCLFDLDVTPSVAGVVPERGIISPAYTAYSTEGSSVFFQYWYNFLHKSGVLLSLCGGLRSTVSKSQFSNYVFAAPPLSEQQAIADYLDRKVGEIDNKISIIERKIELLAELKQSVIYEAVTGKIDVRSHVRDDTSLAA